MLINRELNSLLSAVFLISASSSANGALITGDATADPICGTGDPNICSLENVSGGFLSGVAGDTFEFIYILNGGLNIQLGSEVNPNILASFSTPEPVAVTWSVTMALSDESGELLTEFIPVREDVCEQADSGCGFGGFPNLTPEFDNMTFHDVHIIWATSAPSPVPISGSFGIEFESSVGKVVPIPPAFWLLGSGLLGLISIARRKTA